MIGSDLGWPAHGIARLAFELVPLPLHVRGPAILVSSFNHNLIACSGNRAESAVGVDEVERVEALIHHLPPREKVADWPAAQHDDEQRQRHGDTLPRERETG